ncbi:MAG: gliding motility protein GldC [Flavobacteriales bacterium]
MSAKTTEINIAVSLDENHIPVDMKWTATDTGMENSPAKALMLALWDEKEKNTLRMDLWTKEMTTDEMKQFFHQTLLTMADTLERATGEEKMAGDMRDFCFYFAEKLKLLEQ